MTTDELTVARYQAFLRASQDVLDEVEPAIERWHPPGAAPSRRDRLRADLRDLGVEHAPASNHLSLDRDQALGCAYVMEGAALGGTILARRVVEALGPMPTSYLVSPLGLRSWPRFLALLSAQELTMSADARERACHAACETFDRFSTAYGAAGLLRTDPS